MTRMTRTTHTLTHGRGIKRAPLYAGSPEAAYLRQMSKAALLDLLIETLRLHSGQCDTPLSVEALDRAAGGILSERGDRAPKAVRS